MGFRLGKTINLGNYESLRLDFWKAVNCKPEDEKEVISALEDMVLDKVREWDNKVKVQLKGR